VASGEQCASAAVLTGSAWDRWLSVLLVGGVPLAFYVAALKPLVLDGDSADLARQTWRLGLAYPPGYFLNAVLGRFVTACVPFGTMAWRANLLAALAAVASVVLAYGVLRVWGVSRFVAILGAWLLAFSPLFLSQSLYVNAYMVKVAFALAVVYLLEKWATQRGNALLMASAALFGLGLSAHPSFILYLPAVLLYVILELRREGRLWQGLCVATAALLAGCVPWLAYKVVHLLHREPYLSFGHFLERLVVFLTAAESPSDWRDYFTVVFLERYLSGMALHGVRMLAQFSRVGLLLAIVGVVALWRRRSRSLVLVGTAYLTQMNFAVTMPLWHHFDVYRLSAYALWTLLMGMGLMSIAARCQTCLGRVITPGVLALLTVAVPHMMVFTAPDASARGPDRLRLLRPQPVFRKRFAAEQNSDCGHVLEIAPARSVILSTWGSFATMRYLQEVEGLNRDVQIGCFGGPEQMEQAIAKSRMAGNPNVFILLRLSQHRLLQRVQDLYHTERVFDGLLHRLYKIGKARNERMAEGGVSEDAGSSREKETAV
jgi:hypothetical protein